MTVFHEHTHDDDELPLEIPVWDDLRVNLNAIKLSQVKPPSWFDLQGCQVLSFSAQGVEANEEIVFFTLFLPHKWKIGTHLHPHVHWVGEDTLSGDVVWKLSYSWANEGDVFGAQTNIEAAVPNGAVQNEHNISYLPMIVGTGKKFGSLILCSLRRHSSAAEDTFLTKDAYLLEFDMHYQVDRLGSVLQNSI